MCRFDSDIGGFASAIHRIIIRKNTYRVRFFAVYRERLDEIRKEKGFTIKRWSDESGVSVDTISRTIHPENPEKDAPRITTLEQLCRPLGVDVWEIFYIGDRSLVAMQAELIALKAERDNLLAETAVQRSKIDELNAKVDELKDELLDTHRYYLKSRSQQ